MPTAEPSSTPAAVASPAPGPQIGSTHSAIEELGGQAMEFLEVFTSDYSPRESATGQELEAAQFLAAEFESLGYETSIVPFTVDRVESDVSISSTTLATTTTLRALPFSLSTLGAATGIVTPVGLAFADDIPDEGLRGKVALVQRGTITFEEKVTRVAEAGAVAAIVYNGSDGLFRGALSNRSSIPAVSLSKANGEELIEMLGRGEVSATVAVGQRTLQSRNVIAEMRGAVDDGRSVVVGGHYDTVADVPGADDNGSGVATTMTVARAVAGNPYPFTVRFILFGSEEQGLLGSIDYLRGLSEAQRADIIAMINYDALATGDGLKVLGDGELAATVISAGAAINYPVLRQYTLGNASSDHAVFLQAGVPAIFFLADDFSRIHTPADSLEFVRPGLMGASAALGIALLASFAEG